MQHASWFVYIWVQSIWVRCCTLFLLVGHTNNLQLVSGNMYELEFMFLSIIILTPYIPSRNIYICLQPLINELKQLWSSKALMYDVSKKYNFQMKTTFMWTINNFSMYMMVSGWSILEKLVCSYCMENNKTFTLMNGGNTLFLLPLEVLAKSSLIQKKQKGLLER